MGGAATEPLSTPAGVPGRAAAARRGARPVADRQRAGPGRGWLGVRRGPPGRPRRRRRRAAGRAGAALLPRPPGGLAHPGHAWPHRPGQRRRADRPDPCGRAGVVVAPAHLAAAVAAGRSLPGRLGAVGDRQGPHPPGAAAGRSRLYLGAHWLTDVLGALTLGAAWLFVLLTATRTVHALHTAPSDDHPTPPHRQPPRQREIPAEDPAAVEPARPVRRNREAR